MIPVGLEGSIRWAFIAGRQTEKNTSFVTEAAFSEEKTVALGFHYG